MTIKLRFLECHWKMHVVYRERWALRWFSNNWKWKDSHFHRGRVSKWFRMQVGPSTWFVEREGSMSFMVKFYGSFIYKMDYLLWTRNFHNLFILYSKHHWLISNDRLFIIMISIRSANIRWSVDLFKDGSYRPENTINQSASELYSVDYKITYAYFYLHIIFIQYCADYTIEY